MPELASRNTDCLFYKKNLDNTQTWTEYFLVHRITFQAEDSIPKFFRHFEIEIHDLEASSARRPPDGSVRLKNLPVPGFGSNFF